METKETRDLLQRYRSLLDERARSIDGLCESVAEYIAPNRGRFPSDDKRSDRMHGKRGDKIVDSTQVDAYDVAVNGMFTGLTPPSRQWHKTRFEDDALNDYGPAKEFLEEVDRRRDSLLRQSNFYSSIYHCYAEAIGFANACLYMAEIPAGGFLFRPLTFGEYVWCRNSDGKVDTLMRSEWMTARQLVDTFGEDRVSRQVNHSIKNNAPYVQYEVLHAIEPNSGRSYSRNDNRNMPYKSTWVEIGNDKQVLRESGYETFPFACSVWSLVGSDNYGSDCPGFRALPDVKMLQDMEESCLMATHLELDPPTQVPLSLKGQPIRRTAGGVTYYDGQGEGVKRLYEFKFDLQAGEAKSEAVRNRIRKTFKNDVFMMLSAAEMSTGRQPPTATQILAMDASNKTQIGPFIERQEDELLDPVISYMTHRLIKRWWLYGLPEPPQEVSEQPYRIEYVSMLAQAQKATHVTGIMQGLMFAGQAAQLKPEVLDNYNLDELAREHSDLVGMPASAMYGTEKVQAVRQQREEQMRQQQAMQEASMAMAGAKTLSETKIGNQDPSILSTLLDSGQVAQ